MTSSLLKVSIMTQVDINICVLLLCILLRNIMAFDKELAILYGFFNLKISKKTTLLEKSPNGAQNNFLIFFLDQNTNKFCTKLPIFFVLNQSRSILLVPPKYALEN